ncbi:hypothetical protein V3C99_014319, partial [Haemonchus contortus]
MPVTSYCAILRSVYTSSSSSSAGTLQWRPPAGRQASRQAVHDLRQTELLAGWPTPND